MFGNYTQVTGEVHSYGKLTPLPRFREYTTEEYIVCSQTIVRCYVFDSALIDKTRTGSREARIQHKADRR
jgi:hypothetical protein